MVGGVQLAGEEASRLVSAMPVTGIRPDVSGDQLVVENLLVLDRLTEGQEQAMDGYAWAGDEAYALVPEALAISGDIISAPAP